MVDGSWSMMVDGSFSIGHGRLAPSRRQGSPSWPKLAAAPDPRTAPPPMPTMRATEAIATEAGPLCRPPCPAPLTSLSLSFLPPPPPPFARSYLQMQPFLPFPPSRSLLGMPSPHALPSWARQDAFLFDQPAVCCRLPAGLAAAWHWFAGLAGLPVPEHGECLFTGEGGAAPKREAAQPPRGAAPRRAAAWRMRGQLQPATCNSCDAWRMRGTWLTHDASPMPCAHQRIRIVQAPPLVRLANRTRARAFSRSTAARRLPPPAACPCRLRPPPPPPARSRASTLPDRQPPPHALRSSPQPTPP